MGKVRIAVVGCGFIAKQAHIPNLFLIPNAELVALCDRDKDRAMQAAEQFGVSFKNVYSDPVDVCSTNGIDALVICTPAASHYEIALMASEYGKHAFVEKPLSVTVKEAESMVTSFADKRLTLAVGYYLEWMPQHEYVKRKVHEKAIGEIINITVHDEILGIKPEEGIILDLAPHYIDLLRWYFDDVPIKSVFAVSRKHSKNPDHKETTTEIKLFFENGIIGNIELYWVPGFVNRDGGSKYLKVLGTEGKYSCGLTSGNIEVYRGNTLMNRLRGPYTFVPKYVALPEMPLQATSFRKELEDFVSSIVDKKSPQIPGTVGLEVMRIIDSCFESISSQRIVMTGA